MKPKTQKSDKPNQELLDLTADLQRTRADFENFRKRVESDKQSAEKRGETKAILKLIPVIDTIERAIAHAPQDIAEHQWVKGVTGLVKQLEKSLGELQLTRIDATRGVKFDPEFHQAIQFDDEASGEEEVIDDELQPGYILGGSVIRPALVKVTRK